MHNDRVQYVKGVYAHMGQQFLDVADGHYYNVQLLDKPHLHRQIINYDNDRVIYLHFHGKPVDCTVLCKLVHVVDGEVVDYELEGTLPKEEPAESNLPRWWDEFNEYGDPVG